MKATYVREKDTIIEVVRTPLVTRTGKEIPGAYRETRTVFEGKNAAKTQVDELKVDLENVSASLNDAKRFKPKGMVDKAFKEKLKNALQSIEYDNKHALKTKQNEEIKDEITKRLDDIKKLWPELFKPE